MPDESPDQTVLRIFVAPDGRLRGLPRRRAKRLVVLDHVARDFEVGRRFSEPEVNTVLRGFDHDVAALRRNLVDEGFLSRADGVYWRSGGSVDLHPESPITSSDPD